MASRHSASTTTPLTIIPPGELGPGPNHVCLKWLTVVIDGNGTSDIDFDVYVRARGTGTDDPPDSTPTGATALWQGSSCLRGASFGEGKRTLHIEFGADGQVWEDIGRGIHITVENIGTNGTLQYINAGFDFVF